MLKYFIALFIACLFISKTYLFYMQKAYNQLTHEVQKIKVDLKSAESAWRSLNVPERLEKLSKDLKKPSASIRK